MKERGPLAHPALSRGDRIVAENGFTRVVALSETDAPAATQVDGWEEQHVELPSLTNDGTRAPL